MDRKSVVRWWCVLAFGFLDVHHRRAVHPAFALGRLFGARGFGLAVAVKGLVGFVLGCGLGEVV